MYQMLFTRLALTGASSTQVSQPVSMSGANAAQLDIVVLNLVGTSPQVACQLQESNDLENWTSKGSAVNLTAIGYSMPSAITAIAAAYVRLQVTLTGTSPIAVIAAGLNTAAL